MSHSTPSTVPDWPALTSDQWARVAFWAVRIATGLFWIALAAAIGAVMDGLMPDWLTVLVITMLLVSGLALVAAWFSAASAKLDRTVDRLLGR